MAIQVFGATHDGQGNPLPILERQFISFSYGGRKIEDFNLLAVFTSDRLNKEVYAPFEDIVSDQQEIDGQLFWKSVFSANTLSFSLATDGITPDELEDFKHWFQPGIEKELILTENSNRGILARVSAAPTMSLLPFEKDVMVNIAGVEYPTRTSLYKGDITLSFVMDDPHWYSLKSLINDDELTEQNLKIIFEDGVPAKQMLKADCFLADGVYYQTSGTSLTQVPTLAADTNYYLYYCGTASAKPLIKFTIAPQFSSSSGKVYFNSTNENIIIRFQNPVGEQKNFEFGMPDLCNSYNSAIDQVDNFEGTSILNLRKQLQISLYDYYVRGWVMAIIDYAREKGIGINNNTGEITSLSDFQTFFREQMLTFFDGDLNFSMNSKNGEVLVNGKVRVFAGENLQSTDSTSTYKLITENAGNMIKSKYLIIEDRTLPKNGYINYSECIILETNTSLNNFSINYNYMYL